MKNAWITCFVLLTTIGINAQTGVSGGLSLLKGFGVDKVYTGVHLGIEIPKDDEVSFFVRMTTTLRNYETGQITGQAIDPTTTSPQVVTTDCRFGTSYFNIEGGTRYYLGNGYDYGWSAYGGTLFTLSTMGIRRDVTGTIDESKYQFVSSDNYEYTSKGRTIAVNIGLNAGVKNHFSFGMLYFDVTAGYALFALNSNALARDYSSYSPLLFTFNLGFRKDIF